MLQRRLVAGVTVVAAVAVGGVGGALIGVPGISGAQQFPTTASPNSASNVAADGSTPSARPQRDPGLLDAAAKALNLTTQQLRDKLSDGKTTIADVAKQQNVPVQTVIDAMAAADKARISDIVNNPWPKFGAGPGMGKGGPGRGPLGGLGLGMAGGLGRLGALALDPVAKALGITTDELKTDLAKGQTIADIAKSKNLDVTKVTQTLIDDASKAIDKAVTDGHLPKAIGDKLKDAAKTEIPKIVNDGFPKLPDFGKGNLPKGGPLGGFGFPGRHGLGGTPGGGGSGSSTTTVPPSA